MLAKLKNKWTYKTKKKKSQLVNLRTELCNYGKDIEAGEGGGQLSVLTGLGLISQHQRKGEKQTNRKSQ